MRFEQALQAMRKGKKVKTKNGLAIFYIDGDNIIEEWTDNGYTTAIFNSTMILLEDWEIVDE